MKIFLSFALIIIFICSILVNSPVGALEQDTFNMMIYIGLGEIIYSYFIDPENFGKEMPEEVRPYMIIGGLAGLVLGNAAFQQDARYDSGPTATGLVLIYPLYLLMGVATGAMTGVTTYQTINKFRHSENTTEATSLNWKYAKFNGHMGDSEIDLIKNMDETKDLQLNTSKDEN